MANDSNGDFPHGLRLGRFERNLFFHGKLMTARDMEVEQEYHAGRLDTVARNVLGEGIVTGLQTTVTEENTDLRVRVEPGLALDGDGRVVVVEETDDELTIHGGAVEEDAVSVYLHYADCERETVPVANSGDGCRKECTYNRVREGYRLSYHSGPPTGDRKSVRGDAISFPTPGEAALDEVDRPDPAAVGLHEVAQEYNDSDAGTPDWTGSSTAGTVFLGCFEPPESDDPSWQRRADEHRPYVYTNDMLYAAVTTHAADFDNPHEVTAEQLGAIASVDGVTSPGGDVDLRSADGTIAVGRAEGVDAPHVDLALDGDLHDAIVEHGTQLTDHEGRLNDHDGRLDGHRDRLDAHEGRLDGHRDRLDAHERRLDLHDRRLDAHERRLFYHTWLERSRTLKYQVESFYDVVKTFPEEEAGVLAAELAAFTARAIRETSVRVDSDNAEALRLYVEFLQETVELAAAVLEALTEVENVDERSVERYALAVERLRALLREPPDGSDPDEPSVEYFLQLLVAQSSVCEGARLLAMAEEEPIRLPGGFEIPKGLVNRPLRTSLELQAPDSDDGDADVPVLDPPIVDLPTEPIDIPGGIDPDLPFDRPEYPGITLPGGGDTDPAEPTPEEPTPEEPTPDDPVITDPIVDIPSLDPITDVPGIGDRLDPRRDSRDSDDPTPDDPAPDDSDGGDSDGPVIDTPIIDTPITDLSVDTTPDDSDPDGPVVDTPTVDIPTLANRLPDLTGEPAEELSRLATEVDAPIEFRTPDGETIDPERAREHVVVDQPTEPAGDEEAPRLSFTVVEPQSTDALPGIGDRRSEQLAEAGYPSVEALSKADPEALADALPRVSVGMAEEWVQQAGEHVRTQR